MNFTITITPETLWEVAKLAVVFFLGVGLGGVLNDVEPPSSPRPSEGRWHS